MAKRKKEEIERREAELDAENSALRVLLSAILAGESPTITVEIEQGAYDQGMWGGGASAEYGERFSLYRPKIASGGAVLIEGFERSTGKVVSRDARVLCRMPDYSGDHYRRSALYRLQRACSEANR